MSNFVVADDPMNNPANAVQGPKNRRRISDYFLQNKVPVDYRDTDVMSRFISPEGKILPARRTGLTAKNQRKVMKAIKRARNIDIIPYVNADY